MTKIKLFTHTDLDGVSCAIVAFAAFGQENVDVSYCNYHDINEKFAAFLDSREYKQFEHVYITDISINGENAERLDEYYRENLIKPSLLDHHDVDWLNEYDWATVLHTHGNGAATSGTSMLFEELVHIMGNLPNLPLIALQNYVEIVRKYDTWEWKALGDNVPVSFDKLFWFYGRDRWISFMMYRLLESGRIDQLNEADINILSILEEKYRAYVQKLNSNIYHMNVGRYRAGIVFAEEYISEAGNALHEMNPGFDLIILVNLKSKKVSYRTMYDNVDVGKVAQFFGGGGREKTAGSELKDKQLEQIMDAIFRF